MISANPNTFVEGGFLDDVDVEILEAGTCLWDYAGTRKEDSPALRVVYGYGESQTRIEYYSAGDLKHFVPTTGQEAFQSSYGAAEGETVEIGMGFDAVGDKPGLGKGTKTGHLLLSCVNSGMPPESFDSGNLYAALTGVKGHVNLMPMPEMKERANAPNAEKREGGGPRKPATVLCFTSITAYPGMKQGAKPSGQGKPAAAAKAQAAKAPAATPAAAKAQTPAAAAVSATPTANAVEGALTEVIAKDTYTDKAQEMVLGVLDRQGGAPLFKRDLMGKLFPLVKIDTQFRNWLAQNVTKDDFLGNGPWVYADDQLTPLG